MHFYSNAVKISLLICPNFMNFKGTTNMLCFGSESFIKTSLYYTDQQQLVPVSVCQITGADLNVS